MSSFDHDSELQSYFTDVEHLREMFKQWLATPTMPKRLLIIHGVGGVGKSSLLRMFRLHAKSIHVPVALASGDEQKSALDVLTRWADDLTADGVALPAFKKTLAQYRALYLKVENEAAKIAGKVTKEAAKTLVETAASMIPGIGPLAGKLGGMGVEALTDWLFSRGFKKPDVDLLLDPAKKLTEDFLADVTDAAGKQRLVLLLDTFEQMEALSDWTRDVAQRLHSNILLVIAGRVIPNWDRAWHGWMANAQVEELKPMTEENMRELIRRYYATLRGGEPDPKQVEAIIAFARGLPMVVTSAVQLWVKYGVEDFQAVKPEIVANLVDRLMEGVPKELAPALEAAAIVRWFDQPILRAVMQRDDVRDVYNELRRFPFVRTRAEGLALHDAVREIIDENLRVQDTERHRELHERAAGYFEARLEKATGEEAERFGLERLYHRIRADEETGIKLFREIAEALLNHSLISRLVVLINDAKNYPLMHENSKAWREYYNARLLAAQTKHLDAILHFENIIQYPKVDYKLQLYALGELGISLGVPELLFKPGYAPRAISALYQASTQLSKEDINAVRYYWELLTVHRRLANWEEVNRLYPAFLQMIGSLDEDWHVQFISKLKGLFGTIGNWREFLSVQKELQNIAGSLPPYARAYSLTHWIFAMLWMGRYKEVELLCREGLEICNRFGYGIGTFHRDLAYVLELQGKSQEAEAHRLAWSERLRRDDYYTAVAKERITAVAFGFWGAGDLRAGRLRDARYKLVYSLWVKRRLHDATGMPEVLVALAHLYEVLRKASQAQSYYLRCIKLKWVGRRYFECGALTGLTRVKHAQGDYAAIAPLLAEAEQLAQQYEYNDHLASLRLTQGHIAWEGNAPASENGFDAALRYYQHALIYALRYNRFLLDEVLSGRPQGTPLRPIIPECLKRGEEGRRMLIALRDWWQTGVNDIGTPRPDTISPIPEGIPLLEAERIAREREPGDGSPQRSVVEQIERAR